MFASHMLLCAWNICMHSSSTCMSFSERHRRHLFLPAPGTSRLNDLCNSEPSSSKHEEALKLWALNVQVDDVLLQANRPVWLTWAWKKKTLHRIFFKYELIARLHFAPACKLHHWSWYTTILPPKYYSVFLELCIVDILRFLVWYYISVSAL